MITARFLNLTTSSIIISFNSRMICNISIDTSVRLWLHQIVIWSNLMCLPNFFKETGDEWLSDFRNSGHKAMLPWQLASLIKLTARCLSTEIMLFWSRLSMGGRHEESEYFFANGRAIDTSRYFVIVANMLGNGYSISPNNTLGSIGAGNFPLVTVYDNVRCQHLLITEHLAIQRLRLVTGFSMRAQQSY